MTGNRLILDARCLRGDPGGVASYTGALVENLPALLPNVPIVLLRHPDLPDALSTAPNVTESALAGEPNDPGNFFRLNHWFNERFGPADLFHAPYRVLPRAIKTSCVITIHDVMQVVCPELVFPNPFIRAFVRPYWSFAIHDSLRRADRIIAVSRHSADDAARIEPSCAPRLRVTHLGTSSVFRVTEKTEADRVSSKVIPPGARFFLVLGGGYPNKNHVAAVSAFAKAFKASDQIHLLIIERKRTSPDEKMNLV